MQVLLILLRATTIALVLLTATGGSGAMACADMPDHEKAVCTSHSCCASTPERLEIVQAVRVVVFPWPVPEPHILPSATTEPLFRPPITHVFV
ncbi:hypothetical protein [Falsirhodobacter sp. 1013]|uniref:hypothetical protein n=1 Tax=Falsirhodobacter sp. 1013 TaxID=3417566 RepID=UPI003EBB2D0E